MRILDRARIIFLLFIAVANQALAQKKENPSAAPSKDDAKLPRVLLIGDSISIGYTRPVQEQLQDIANVHRIPGNGGDTNRGLKNLDPWLGEKKWDVIHFNWGLHDVRYTIEKGADVDPTNGRYQVPLEEYEKNLKVLARRLKESGAKLIWASLTSVPEGADGRIPGDVAKYNAAAARIMKAEGIPVNDLYTFALERLEKIQQPKNVHFTPEGSQQLAEQVSGQIRKALGVSTDDE